MKRSWKTQTESTQLGDILEITIHRRYRVEQSKDVDRIIKAAHKRPGKVTVLVENILIKTGRPRNKRA